MAKFRLGFLLRVMYPAEEANFKIWEVNAGSLIILFVMYSVATSPESHFSIKS
jgi:hypothetical protein